MSAGSLPSALTRGYAKSFKDMLVESVNKVLTIKELKDLDDLEVGARIARSELENRIESDHAVPN